MLATHAIVFSFIILMLSRICLTFTTTNNIILTDSQLDDYESYLRTELERVDNERKLKRLKRSIDSDASDKIEKTVSFLTRILPFQLKKTIEEAYSSDNTTENDVTSTTTTATTTITTTTASGESSEYISSSTTPTTSQADMLQASTSEIIEVTTSTLSTTNSRTSFEPTTEVLSSATPATTTINLTSPHTMNSIETTTIENSSTDIQMISPITAIELNEDPAIELLADNQTISRNDLELSNMTTLVEDIVSLTSVLNDDQLLDNSTVIEGATDKLLSTTLPISQTSQQSDDLSTPSSSTQSSDTVTSSPSYAADAQATIRFRSNIITNITSEVAQHCQQYTQPQLVAELKQKGTYNPDLMAWDAMGILRFIDKTVHDQYQKEVTSPRQLEEIVEKNTKSLKSLLSELNVTCTVADDSVRARLRQLSLKQFRRTIISPSLRRTKRMNNDDVWMSLLNATLTSEHRLKDYQTGSSKQRLIGESHAVPFGCDKRGSEEDGYLRLCGACQTIRHLPETFFPPFINEVTCDTDKACLYFYDYPHGKCRQRHMNFFVLRNVGTKECQVWKKYNLNVRVSCECFVDEMSFFSKYV